MAPIYAVAEVIAEVDFLCSLATAAIKYDLVKPTFDAEETEITDGKHPILLTMKKTNEEEATDQVTVPNSTNLDAVANFQLITGPNM